jgi:glucan phosphorylase
MKERMEGRVFVFSSFVIHHESYGGKGNHDDHAESGGPSYAQAQHRLGELYADPDAWTRKAIMNVACSGKFSTERTIAEHVTGIWDAAPRPVGDQ